MSIYLLRAYRREYNLSRPKTLRILKSEEGCESRQRLGFEEEFPKWRCAKACLGDPQRTVPDCDYLDEKYKHGYTTTVEGTD